MSSNGFAAHPDLVAARKNSKLELIERAEILSSWQTPAIWRKGNSLLASPMSLLIKTILGKDWTLEFFEVSSSPDYLTLLGLLTHPTEGSFFDSVCTDNSNLNPTNALKSRLKLTNSLLRSAPFYSSPLTSIDELPEIGSPIDHLRFYKNALHLKAFDVHRQIMGSGKGILDSFEKICTTDVFNVEGFPALCFSVHPDWPTLKLGKASLENGKIWPHPIG